MYVHRNLTARYNLPKSHRFGWLHIIQHHMSSSLHSYSRKVSNECLSLHDATWCYMMVHDGTWWFIVVTLNNINILHSIEYVLNASRMDPELVSPFLVSSPAVSSPVLFNFTTHSLYIHYTRQEKNAPCDLFDWYLWLRRSKLRIFYCSNYCRSSVSSSAVSTRLEHAPAVLMLQEMTAQGSTAVSSICHAVQKTR